MTKGVKINKVQITSDKGHNFDTIHEGLWTLVVTWERENQEVVREVINKHILFGLMIGQGLI